MVTELKITRQRGGNRHPLSVTDFIQSHLSMVGEDYISSMHRAYKLALDTLAKDNGRKRRYHRPTYHSFEMQVQKLTRAGAIEFSGREEESDSPQFINWDDKPVRRYYRLARSLNGRLDGATHTVTPLRFSMNHNGKKEVMPPE
jgi:hypothetical protein